jgi:hypothetical protein
MPAKYQKITVTEKFLNEDPASYFVYGDNMQRKGLGGAAKLRNHPRAIGFITKKAPAHESGACFKPEEYASIFFDQLRQLAEHVRNNPGVKFYISKLGSGLANRYWIWERIISHNLQDEFEDCDNVIFCWDRNEENLTSNETSHI